MLKIFKILLLFVWCNIHAQAYTLSQVPYSPKPLLGILIPAVDDAVYGPFPITFDFCFWGNQYSQMYVGTNGWVGFSPGQSPSFTSFPIPNTAANVPKNCIMGPWYDLHPGTVGAMPSTPMTYIYYQSYGTYPNRYMVVTWNNIPLYNCIAIRGTQQIVLYENGNIENSIIEKRICSSWANGTATQGLHNISGTQAIIVGTRNSTQWTVSTSSPETWRYTPNYPIFVPCCPMTNLNSN